MGLEAVNNQPVSQVSENNNVPETAQTPKAEVTGQTESDAGKASKVGELQNQASQLKFNIVNRPIDPPPPKDFSKEATVTKVGNQIVIDAGVGDDKIAITQNAKTGEVTVNVNGASKTFSKADSENLIVKAGDGNDTINVGKGVTVKLRLEGEKGNDTIAVDKDVIARQFISGGDGGDTLTGGAGADKIEAGAGDDTVDGGLGDDYINGSKGKDTLKGGIGNDVIYGGDDNDSIDGGDGNDYLEGSKGNDTIAGGKGTDVLSGGIGDDTLRGGDGDDVLYAGQGKDQLFGDKGNNTIYSQKDDQIEPGRSDAEQDKKGINNKVVTVELKGNPAGTGVVINGSDEFKERVEADLEMLRSSPKGRAMLQSFDDANAATTQKDSSGKVIKKGVTVTITEETNPLNMRATFDTPGVDPTLQPAYDAKGNVTGYTKGTPGSSTIYYSPDIMLKVKGADNSVVDFLPSVSLFHEMAHAYDFTHGTLRGDVYAGKDAIDANVSEAERVATGLEMDHDANPKTDEKLDSVNHSNDLTENALRAEMNRDKREHYGFKQPFQIIRD